VKRVNVIVIVLCGAWFPLFLFSQTNLLQQLPIVSADSNKANIHFERNVYTYFWNFNTTIAHRDTVINVRLTDKFTSSLIRRNFRSFRDENTFAFDVSHSLSEEFSLNGEARSFLLSDNQSLGTSKSGIHSVLTGISYRPVPTVYLSPMIGMRYDKQQNENDDGINLKFFAGADSLEFSGYRASLNGEFNQSDLDPRKFAANLAQISIATEFAEGSTDSVRVRWFNNRWDFYIPADENVKNAFGVSSNIRTRNEQLFGVQNMLLYNIGAGLTTRLTTTVESRKIANAFRYKSLSVLSAIPFNTTVHEFRLEGAMDVLYRSRSILSSVGLHISERDEKHLLEKIDGADQSFQAFQENRARQESRLDNTALRSTLRGNLSALLTSDDELSFAGSASVLRYDTPDSLNTDDRDELLFNLAVKETHRFSPVFQAGITAEATLGHIVYLYKDKSANNNWNRIFRLSPELIYRPSETFRIYNKFEVLANYTVFDFEIMIPTVKSYSYRQVAFLDSTSYDITPKVGIDLFAHVRIFERGELKWKEFSERPQQYIEEVTFSPQIRYRYKEQWYFAVGFRSFAQKRFRYVNAARQFESTFLSAGPTTHIVLRFSPQSQIEISGWKEFQRQSGQRIQDFSNMTMNVRYFF